LLPIGAVAERLGASTRHVRRLIERGSCRCTASAAWSGSARTTSPASSPPAGKADRQCHCQPISDHQELLEAGWQPYGYGAVAPTIAAIRAGDMETLAFLLGILRVQPAPGNAGHPLGRGAAFVGVGTGELQQRGRPPSVRWEQLAVWLGVIYEFATGRAPGRGERTPFTTFFRLLVALLTESDLDERGDRLLRRVAKRRKAPPSP
jgi:hypothetical protein